MWAYEFDAGKFIAGEILGDTLYMYAPTGRGEKWVMNSEGVVLEYSSEPSHKSDEIIAGINAHYGTSFYQEDDIDKDFTIGETMPNWNAYEKILLPAKEYFAFHPTGNSAFVTGFVQGDNAFFNANSSNAVWMISPEGSVWGSGGQVSTYSAQAKQLLLNEYGKEFEVIEGFVENWEMGQTVPNWENYNILG